MLEKLAKQSAIYGVSTVVGRLLGYLLTPYFTRIFTPDVYGIITDVYAITPFALVLLSIGMESSFFHFAKKAEQQSDVKGAMDRLFSTAWGVTSAAALAFVVLVALFLNPACRAMGEAYVANPLYIVLMASIIMFDVMAMIPFARLRQQDRPKEYVMFKLLNISLQVGLSIGFGYAGLYSSEFGVGWALVANVISSAVAFVAILATLRGMKLRMDWVLLSPLLAYSVPLMYSGIAGTATDFIDRQMIKFIIPTGAMSQLGIYGAVTKIAVVMTIFTQTYRLAAEPFFLSQFKDNEDSQFKEKNAEAMKYYVMASMLIFLGISLFRNLFALIVGTDYREGIYILPVVLGANLFMGMWLNMSFWYKREEQTKYALYITLTGLAVAVASNLVLIPMWGYYGAAWSRFIAEGAMVVVSYYLNCRYYPTPYDLGRIAEYVVLAVVLFFAAEWLSGVVDYWYVVNSLLLLIYFAYAVWREKINLRGLINSMLGRCGLQI